MLQVALQAQNSHIHLLEAAIYLLEYEACGGERERKEKRKEWAREKLALQMYTPVHTLVCTVFHES